MSEQTYIYGRPSPEQCEDPMCFCKGYEPQRAANIPNTESPGGEAWYFLETPDGSLVNVDHIVSVSPDRYAGCLIEMSSGRSHEYPCTPTKLMDVLAEIANQ